MALPAILTDCRGLCHICAGILADSTKIPTQSLIFQEAAQPARLFDALTPGKYNAPDHRFVAGDRECFYCIALKTISDCSRMFRLVALSKGVDLGLIWTIRALGLI